MGQVTIYLEAEIEKKMIAAAKSMHLSKSKWVAQLIEEKVTHEWPQSVLNLAGAWQDVELAEDARKNLSEDLPREAF